MALDDGDGEGREGAQGQGRGGGRTHGIVAGSGSASQARVGSGGSCGPTAAQGRGDGGTGGDRRAAAIADSRGRGGGPSRRVAVPRDDGGGSHGLAVVAGATGIYTARPRLFNSRALDMPLHMVGSGVASAGIAPQGQGLGGTESEQHASAIAAIERFSPQRDDQDYRRRMALQFHELPAAAVAAFVAGLGIGGATGAADAQRPAPQYNIQLVEVLVERNIWGALEDYLNAFIRRAGDEPNRHPVLIFHCRRSHLIYLLRMGRHTHAMRFYMSNIAGSAIRNAITPYADSDMLKSDVDEVHDAMVRGKPMEEQDVAARINDYMRFNFPEIIRHPWQGKSPFWRFALKLGRQPTRHAIFRCLLCQTVFEKGSLQTRLERHLNHECRAVTPRALDLLRDIKISITNQENIQALAHKKKYSAHKRPESSMVISKDHSKSSKVARTQLVGPSTSKQPTDLETVVADGSGTETSLARLGYALLESLSSLLPQEFAVKLEISLDIINWTPLEEIKWKEATQAKAVLLDTLLSTDLDKEKCRELSNYFDYIISQTLHQSPPSGQSDAAPTHLPQNSDPGVLFNIDGNQLQLSVQSDVIQPATSAQVVASSSTQLMETNVTEAPPSQYDYLSDFFEEEPDGGPKEQAQLSPRSEQSAEP